jgi:glycosyltransferase involved in cell wall biosynthesis
VPVGSASKRQVSKGTAGRPRRFFTEGAQPMVSGFLSGAMNWILPARRRIEGRVREALKSAQLGRTKAASDALVKILLTTDVQSISTPAAEGVVAIIDCLAQRNSSHASHAREAFATALITSSQSGPARTDDLSEPRIAYIPNARMPSSAANCVHVMKMCSAIAKSGYIVRLFFEESVRDKPIDSHTFRSEFGVGGELNYTIVARDTNAELRKTISALQWGATHVYTRSLRAGYLSALARVPTLLELHSPISEQHSCFARELFRLPAFIGLIVITEALRRQVLEVFPGLHDKIHVIPDGADLIPDGADLVSSNLDNLEHTSNQAYTINVGYVGQLYRGKGLDIVLKIAERLPSIGFHIFGGEDPELSLWKNKCSHLTNVTFYGHYPHALVPGVLSSLDIVLAPYQRTVMARGATLDIAKWMSPLKIFEYMAAGKAIVGSNLPVLREVLENGRNCLLCEPDDIDDWVNSISMLSQNQELRSRLGSEAKRELEEAFTWTKRAERALSFLVKTSCSNYPTSSSGDSAGSKPSVCWIFEPKLWDWAYGVNSRRLASTLPNFHHNFGDQNIQQCDIKLCFDIISHVRSLHIEGKSIVRIGGPGPLKSLSGGNLVKLRRAFADVSAVIALTPELQNLALEFHPHVFFILNGLDLGLWRKEALLQRSPGQPFRAGVAAALKTARQREIKGLDIARKACDSARVELTVVGRGWEHIPHDRMIEEFYSKIDVLLHPVGPGKEASSNVIMECLALGIPVITTPEAGYHGRHLTSGYDAMVVGRDPESMARALVTLKHNIDLRHRLSAAGRVFAELHHDLGSIARQYERVFHFALASDPPGVSARAGPPSMPNHLATL